MSESQQMANFITGAWISQLVYVTAKLKLADLVAQEARTPHELAGLTDTRPEPLARALRALASLGIFRSTQQGRYETTPLAETLRSDVPGSQWALAIMMGEEHYRCWGDLLYSLQTGQKSFDKLYGQQVFEYLGSNPDAARVFDAAMTSVHGRESLPMAQAYDFSRFGRVVDIGGGNGSLLSTILNEHPNVKGIVFDLPGVIARTKESIAQAELDDRLSLETGNFFESVPPGADCYLMRHIIHDWTDEECGVILKNCHDAMSNGATLLIAESVIPDGDEPFFGKLLDLTMLLIPGGKERTADEYAVLLAANGFEMTRIIPTATEVSYVEARKSGG